MAALPLDEGELFAGKYRIIRCLASGGMGAVYEAVHTVTERRCALKVMLGHTVEREKLRKRFMQESKVAAQIGSDYIVDVLDAGIDERSKSPYLVMELLEGEDLGQRIVRHGPLPPADVVLYLTHTAVALDRTHRAGIVHRDLKASNLFLTRREDGSPLVKVLDFGVAKVMPLEATSEGHTQTVGTPIYMAPEQFRAGGRVSTATDIYALGMLTFTLLVGVHYWKAEHDRCENPFAFANIAVHGPGEPPTVRAARYGVALPPAFDDWFAIATSREPQDRFRSAREAVSSLAAILGIEQPAVATPSQASGFDPLSPISSRPLSMPDTVESPSARLSQFGQQSSVDSGPIVTIDSEPNLGPNPTFPSEAEFLRERTEVSLSVTNAGGLDMLADAPIARPRHRWVVVSMGAIALVGIAMGLRAHFAESSNHVTPLASTNLQTDNPDVEEKNEDTAAKSASPERILEVTSIEELPTATEDDVTEPRSRLARHAVRRRRTAKPPPKEEQEPAAAPTKTASTPPPEKPKAPAVVPSPSNRERLYSRD